jgi:hypothetical protein
MTLTDKISLLLLLVIVSGCAGALERPETTVSGEARAVDRERQEKEQETAPPTFTYRP